ncbi:MAG: hypothetical protein ACR2IK_02775, partial [Chloroflexota bacterium]
MIIDARGGLWFDNPLLVLGLLSVLWVLIAWLHTDPCLNGYRHLRQLSQRVLNRLGRIRIVLQAARQVGIVRAHIEVAMARRIEEDQLPLARLAR